MTWCVECGSQCGEVCFQGAVVFTFGVGRRVGWWLVKEQQVLVVAHRKGSRARLEKSSISSNFP